MDNNLEYSEYETEQPVLKINPKFDFIYELGMPTGKKIKSSILLILIFSVGLIIFCSNRNKIGMNKLNGINIGSVIFWVLLIILLISVIKLIVHIVMKKMQYKNITYSFYSDHMYYEDSFLNQHRKNIKYTNIKEVEIRRTIWDRILGFGIIVIYTNAENEYSNGLVIYGIKEPEKYYNTIEKLIHVSQKQSGIKENVKKDEEKCQKEDNITSDKINNAEEVNSQTHEEFLESLKHVNNQDNNEQ